MSDAMIEQIRMPNRDIHCRSILTAQNLRSLTDDLKRHFQKNYPVMLDGALPRSDDQGNLLRQARESLTKGHGNAHTLPSAIIREALDSIPLNEGQEVLSPVKAGFTAVGPKTGRIWWDKSILDSLDDVLSRLDSPRAVLRFYDITGLDPESERWNDFFDIDIEIKANGQTVNFWAADHAYIVDLGYIHADGRFLRVARTNLVHLPREGDGAADNDINAQTLLKARSKQTDPEIKPDAVARDWAAERLDHEERDLDTELIVHMIYRSFLREGPRALRRAPRLFRRETEVLRKEFTQRQRARERFASTVVSQITAPVVLAARLDPVVSQSRATAPSAMLPAVWERRESTLLSSVNLGRERFGWHDLLLRESRRVAETDILPEAGAPVVHVEAENDEPDRLELVRVFDGANGDHEAASFMPHSVFETAQNLRTDLTSVSAFEPVELLESCDDDDVEGDSNREEDIIQSLVSRRRERSEGESEQNGDKQPVRLFGGSEAKRMAKAGVRVTRMALTLEGKMRPGARLKVAGKLVRADADGRFKLECVLTGKRASIPMRAGASIGGEARSLINVEWEKRASRERKKIW